MKRPIALAIVSLTFGTCALASPLTTEPPLRVGTIDSQSLVVAYYRSDVHAKVIADLRAQEKDAKANGDTARVKALNAEGGRIQDLAHQQLEGKAPVDSLVARIKPQIEAAATSAHVELVIEGRVLASPRQFELVDITDGVLAAQGRRRDAPRHRRTQGQAAVATRGRRTRTKTGRAAGAGAWRCSRAGRWSSRA